MPGSAENAGRFQLSVLWTETAQPQSLALAAQDRIAVLRSKAEGVKV